jgi:TPR repeat protein
MEKGIKAVRACLLYVTVLSHLDNAEAQYKVGVMLKTGEGVPRDEAEGTKWIMQAARRGYSP